MRWWLLALGACALLTLTPRADARAPRPPIVFVVLDEFPTTSLVGRNRHIDAVRYPNFGSLARDATWFRNAATDHDSSFASIPSMLDGRRAVYKKGALRHSPRSTVLGLAAAHGYRVEASAEARGICPVRFCGRLHSTRYYLVRSRVHRFEQFVDSIGPRSTPTFWFKHTLLPHVPWIYMPDGTQYQRGARGPFRGLNSERGASEPTLVHLAQQRHLLQVQLVDRLVGLLVRRLQTTGLYDRALVVIAADEGISFGVGLEDRRMVDLDNVQDVAPVPLFVKLPGQRSGRVSRVYARTSDIAPTIARVAGLRIPWRTVGRPLFSRAVARRRGIRIGTRSPSRPILTVGGPLFQRRWGGSIRRQHSIFGFGARGPGLVGAGPARRLRGRSVASLAVAHLGAARAVIHAAREFAAVRLSSRFRPSLVAGRVVGGRRGARRNLAVAINGTVVATSRTFYLRGSATERFAVLVPDALFKEGRNRVQLLTMRRVGRRLRLRLLGQV